MTSSFGRSVIVRRRVPRRAASVRAVGVAEDRLELLGLGATLARKPDSAGARVASITRARKTKSEEVKERATPRSQPTRAPCPASVSGPEPPVQNPGVAIIFSVPLVEPKPPKLFVADNRLAPV